MPPQAGLLDEERGGWRAGSLERWCLTAFIGVPIFPPLCLRGFTERAKERLRTRRFHIFYHFFGNLAIVLGLAVVGVPVAVAIIVAVVVSVGKEVYDATWGPGHADWWDLFYDFLGIAVAVGLIGLWWLGRPAML
jgi:hypothetical protein